MTPRLRRFGRTFGEGSTYSRAQSEVTGSVLLVGVIAVVITVSGGLLLANYVENVTEDEPQIDLDVTANETNVTLIHGGGHVLDPETVTVYLRSGGSEREWLLSTWSFYRDDDDGRFQPAERATGPNPYGPGRLDVFVVHRRGGTVLLDVTLQVASNTTATG